jgi:hypothetical protein
MGLFNKKMSLEDILKAIEGLTDEEKAKVKAKMEEPTESTEETNEVPEQVQGEPVEEKSEEVTEQPAMEEGESVEETDGEVLEGENLEQPTEPPVTEPTNPEIPPETEQFNDVEQDNKDDVLHGLSDRIQALEEKLSEFEELKALMEDYTKKQADSFGYKGAVPGAKKDIHEMSASELKSKMLNGEI